MSHLSPHCLSSSAYPPPISLFPSSPLLPLSYPLRPSILNVAPLAQGFESDEADDEIFANHERSSSMSTDTDTESIPEPQIPDKNSISQGTYLSPIYAFLSFVCFQLHSVNRDSFIFGSDCVLTALKWTEYYPEMKLLRFTERTFCNLKLLLWRKFLIDDYFITKKIQYEVLSVRIYSLIGFTAVCTTSLYYTVLYLLHFTLLTLHYSTLFFSSHLLFTALHRERGRGWAGTSLISIQKFIGTKKLCGC